MTLTDDDGYDLNSKNLKLTSGPYAVGDNS